MKALQVRMERVRKTFPGVVAVADASIDLYDGEIHAILGENGAGKTTLMSILYGMLNPDEGTIRLNGTQVSINSSRDAIRHGIGMVHQEFLLVRRMNVVDNVILGMTGSKIPRTVYRQIDRKAVADRIAELSGRFQLEMDPYSVVEDLSVGAQQRLEILKLLYRDAQLLILDEPTAVLSPPEVVRLFDILRSLCEDGRSVALVTHKLKDVQQHADRVTVMRRGETIKSWTAREMTADELATEMVGYRVSMVRRSGSADLGAVALEVSNLTVVDKSGVERVSELSFSVRAGEIFGVAGVDGNGQDHLARCIAGLEPASKGSVLLGGVDVTEELVSRRRIIGVKYIPADRRAIGSVHELSIAENLSICSDHPYPTKAGILDKGTVRDEAETAIADYEISAPGWNFTAGNLSGGNLQKVILARELRGAPKVIVVEHATRGLDIASTQQVRQILLNQRQMGAAIVFISADLEELMALSDRVGVMFSGAMRKVAQVNELDIERLGRWMAGLDDHYGVGPTREASKS